MSIYSKNQKVKPLLISDTHGLITNFINFLASDENGLLHAKKLMRNLKLFNINQLFDGVIHFHFK